jgi:hypothetical protein
MQKYEYDTFLFLMSEETHSVKLLNEAANKGWRIRSAIYLQKDSVLIFMERKIVDPFFATDGPVHHSVPKGAHKATPPPGESLT